MTLAQLVHSLLGVANALIPLLIGLALVSFFVGLVDYVRQADSSSAKERGRTLIQWGLIAIFLLVCIWGVVDFISIAFLGQSTLTAY